MGDKLLIWLDAPRMIGFIFACGTVGYVLFITVKHHRAFWEGITGDDGKLQFLEAALTIWLALFVPMVIADYAFGLVASDKAWWSMDSIFFIGVGGKSVEVVTRSKGSHKTTTSSSSSSSESTPQP